jgi:hypothetical protein
MGKYDNNSNMTVGDLKTWFTAYANYKYDFRFNFDGRVLDPAEALSDLNITSTSNKMYVIPKFSNPSPPPA